MTDLSQRNASVDVDVLIVGAGPTGLMLANQLARRGVKPRIIDRHSGPAQQSRAMAVQARTMEIYSRMGLIDKALSLGERATGHTQRIPGQFVLQPGENGVRQRLAGLQHDVADKALADDHFDRLFKQVVPLDIAAEGQAAVPDQLENFLCEFVSLAQPY